MLNFKELQDLENGLLAPFEEKPFEFYNSDVTNFRDSINEVFQKWQSSLCEFVRGLVEEGQAALRRHEEEQEDMSAEDKDHVMKQLARAIQIAEAAAGSEAAKYLAEVKEIRFNLTEASGARPEKNQSTALFEQAGMRLFPAQVASQFFAIVTGFITR